MTNTRNWTDTLTLRPEVIASDGGVGDLQMSLHKAVYQTVDVPYREVSYYAEITQPTPNLIGFLARVARRLGGTGESVALFHLDQGMGGGKSHALVGLYHMASNPAGVLRHGPRQGCACRGAGRRQEHRPGRHPGGHADRRPLLSREAERGVRTRDEPVRAVPVGCLRRRSGPLGRVRRPAAPTRRPCRMRSPASAARC